MSDYPIKNRQADALPEGVVEIIDAAGTAKRFEGENLLVACASHYSDFKPLKLGEPGMTSLLSGEPGYAVGVEDLRVGLTLDEFIHLALNALNPSQYETLRETYGLFSLIDTRYYEPDTGKALQPKIRVARG